MKVLSIANDKIRVGIPGGVAGQFEVFVTIDNLGNAISNPATANDFKY